MYRFILVCLCFAVTFGACSSSEDRVSQSSGMKNEESDFVEVDEVDVGVVEVEESKVDFEHLYFRSDVGDGSGDDGNEPLGLCDFIRPDDDASLIAEVTYISEFFQHSCLDAEPGPYGTTYMIYHVRVLREVWSSDFVAQDFDVVVINKRLVDFGRRPKVGGVVLMNVRYLDGDYFLRNMVDVLSEDDIENRRGLLLSDFPSSFDELQRRSHDIYADYLGSCPDGYTYALDDETFREYAFHRDCDHVEPPEEEMSVPGEGE